MSHTMTYTLPLLRGQVPGLIAYAVGYMAGGDNLTRPFTMPRLIIKKPIGSEGLEKRGFIQTTEKQ